MPLLRLISICLVLMGGPLAAVAQGTQVGFGTVKADPSAPVEATADQLDVDQDTGAAIFTGNVVIAQGLMKLSAPRVLVVNKPEGGISRMEATGGVLLVSGDDAAEAQRADYSVDDGVIVMSGDVVLTRGPNIITSERMNVNLVTGTAVMTGRVKTVLIPKQTD